MRASVGKGGRESPFVRAEVSIFYARSATVLLHSTSPPPMTTTAEAIPEHAPRGAPPRRGDVDTSQEGRERLAALCGGFFQRLCKDPPEEGDVPVARIRQGSVTAEQSEEPQDVMGLRLAAPLSALATADLPCHLERVASEAGECGGEGEVGAGVSLTPEVVTSPLIGFAFLEASRRQLFPSVGVIVMSSSGGEAGDDSDAMVCFRPSSAP